MSSLTTKIAIHAKRGGLAGRGVPRVGPMRTARGRGTFPVAQPTGYGRGVWGQARYSPYQTTSTANVQVPPVPATATYQYAQAYPAQTSYQAYQNYQYSQQAAQYAQTGQYGQQTSQYYQTTQDYYKQQY